MTEEARCPACGAFTGFRRSRAQGLWEKSLARLGGLKAYRCEACHNRVLRRWLPVVKGAAAAPAPGDAARAREPFASQQGTDEFAELIREISAAERRRASGGPRGQ